MVEFVKETDGSIVLATFTGCQVALFAKTAVGLCIEFRRDWGGSVETVQVSIPPDEAKQLGLLLQSAALEGEEPAPPGAQIN